MGCEKNNQPPITVKKVQSVEVKKEETEERFGKIYAKGSKLPYSGKIISFFASGEKAVFQISQTTQMIQNRFPIN